MSTIEQLSEALQRGNAKEVTALVQEALDNGVTAQRILDEGLLRAWACSAFGLKQRGVCSRGSDSRARPK